MTNMLIMGTTVNTDNNNRGCHALGLGVLSLFEKESHRDFYTILNMSRDNNCFESNVIVNGKKIKVITQNISNIYFRRVLFDILPYLITGKSKNKLINFLKGFDVIYNINWGDGFTDIYGLKRMLLAFIETIIPVILRKKVIFLPQTIGPFDTIIGKILSSIALKLCEKIYVRDNMANNYLNKLNIDYKKCFDLSVYMQPEPIDIILPKNAIGINVSGLLYFGTDLSNCSKFDNYNLLIESLITNLLAKGYNIVLIPHTYNSIMPELADDLEACKDIAKKFNSSNITIIDQNYTAPQLKYIISQMEFFIGSRMHANFAALSTSTPVIGIAYSYKFKGGFKMFDVEECVINAKNISKSEISQIIDKILALIEQKENIKNKLQKVNSEIEEFSLI